MLDKPEGISSFDVIRRLRKIYSESHGGEKAPKMGHAGTLDPAASGLMLIGVGKGTKKLNDYIKLDKEYVAGVVLGLSTTSGDREGEILEEVETVEISLSEISTAIDKLVGTLRLPVSAYSAIKKNGVPMYKRARAAAARGETIDDVPVRDMTVYEAELLSVKKTIINDGEKVVVEVRFKVASGTYVRSLGEELGRLLGYPASLLSLRRTKVGEFSVSDVVKIAK